MLGLTSRLSGIIYIHLLDSEAKKALRTDTSRLIQIMRIPDTYLVTKRTFIL